MNQKQHQNKSKLTEGLRSGDLSDMVSPVFSIDQYKSKMGDDEDTVVIAFKVKEKMAATDLMEFIEKGYQAVLDADMSSGEERDGQYSVFVELERNTEVPQHILDILEGLDQLTNCDTWNFKYHKVAGVKPANIENLKSTVPLSIEDYHAKQLISKETELQEFFNQGTVTVQLDKNDKINFSKPFSGDLDAQLVTFGKYEDVKNRLPGKLSLDESSQSQVLFLTKYLGNYSIDKIDNKFLIVKGNQAVILEKERW